MKIKFLGANTSVTGSCHMITTRGHKFLLDCGMFQGSDEMDQLNSEPFDFDPEEIEFVLLSHAHVDHSGRIPLLVKRGFKGRIYCTDATADLLGIMLRDSAFIQQKETEWKNRKNQRAGLPLWNPYTMADAEAALSLVTPVLYDQLIELNDGIKVVFNDAGHILGSAIIEVFVTEDDAVSKLVYSGDLGSRNRPILRDPTIIKKPTMSSWNPPMVTESMKETPTALKGLWISLLRPYEGAEMWSYPPLLLEELRSLSMSSTASMKNTRKSIRN